MNRLVNIKIATVAVLAFAGAAQAASDKAFDQMLDTCVQHFVATSLADYQGKVTVKKTDSSFDSNGPSLIAGNGGYRITVSAVRRPGGTQLATATCQMARDGSIVSIKSVPLASKKLQHAEPVVVAKNNLK